MEQAQDVLAIEAVDCAGVTFTRGLRQVLRNLLNTMRVSPMFKRELTLLPRRSALQQHDLDAGRQVRKIDAPCNLSELGAVLWTQHSIF